MTREEIRKKYDNREINLHQMADEIASYITVRTETDNGYFDEKRLSTDFEKEIISKIVYAALFSYSWKSKYDIESILFTARNVFEQFFPQCSSYETIYLPFKEMVGLI